MFAREHPAKYATSHNWRRKCGKANVFYLLLESNERNLNKNNRITSSHSHLIKMWHRANNMAAAIANGTEKFEQNREKEKWYGEKLNLWKLRWMNGMMMIRWPYLVCMRIFQSPYRHRFAALFCVIKSDKKKNFIFCFKFMPIADVFAYR